MNKYHKRDQRGFTLIELLVVIAILAMLFGVTALALTGVGSNAESRAAGGEMDVVQSAIDTYLAVSSASSVTARDCYQPGPNSTEIGGYLRRTSKFYYKWGTNGTVTSSYSDPDCAIQMVP